MAEYHWGKCQGFLSLADFTAEHRACSIDDLRQSEVYTDCVMIRTFFCQICHNKQGKRLNGGWVGCRAERRPISVYV